MKKFLIVANTASMVHLFNEVNLEVVQNAGYEIHIACNFVEGNTTSQEEVDNYINDWKKRNFVLHNIGFLRSPFSLKSFSVYKATKELITKNNFDIIHCHTPIVSAFVRYAARKMRKNGTKVIYTAHGFHFYNGCPLFNWLTYYPIEKMLASVTDVLITINQEDYERALAKFPAKRLIHMYGVGIDVEKIKSIPAERNEIRRQLGLKPDDKILISVGELNDNKNHKVVIPSLAMCKREDLHYVVAGIGYAGEELLESAKHNNVEDKVHLLGYRGDVLSLLKASDIFIFPSYREGLSVALMEAMASGLPIVASMIRGNTDLVDNEMGGYLCFPNDSESYAKAITTLLDDPAHMKRMGEYNQDKIQLFNKSSVSYTLIELIKDLEREEKADGQQAASDYISEKQWHQSGFSSGKRN